MSLLKTEVRDGVALVTLNDPARRNALSLDLAREIVERLAALEEDPAVSALVLTGTPPAFSAGAALEELAVADRDRLQRIYRGFLALAHFPLPTIAAVNGPAIGAGMNLALACDVRLAGPDARFESRFADLALHPGGGHTWMLQRLLGPQGAAALVLYGEPLDGEEAVRCGLAWRSVEDVVGESLRLAGRSRQAPRDLARRVKQTLREMTAVAEHDTATAGELEAQLWSVRQPVFRRRIADLQRRIATRKKGPA